MLRSRLVTILLAGTVGVLFVTALAVHGVVSALLLLGVAGLLGVLSAAAWPVIPGRGRRLRVLVIVLVVALAAVRAFAAR